MNHLYVVPTNRRSVESISSLFTEIKDLPNFTGILLDSSEGQDYLDNHNAFLKVKRDLTTVYHVKQATLDDKLQSALLDEGIPTAVIELVTGNVFSYGRLMNRTSLIAEIFGCRYVHRRDSDTSLQYREGRVVKPIELENRGFSDNKFLVGSSYIGDWGIDYKDVETDMSALKALFSLSKPAYSDAQLEDYITNKYVKGSTDVYHGMDVISSEKTNYIDVGNMAYRDIFRYLPVSPAVLTSGTDYLYLNIFDQLKLPMIYHNRRVNHQYTSNRYDLMSYLKYDQSKALSRVMKVYLSSIIGEISAQSMSDLGDSVAQLAREKANSSELAASANRTLTKFVKIYGSLPYTHYKEGAKLIDSMKSELIKKTQADVLEFATLAEMWPSIIKAVENIDPLNIIVS